MVDTMLETEADQPLKTLIRAAGASDSATVQLFPEVGFLAEASAHYCRRHGLTPLGLEYRRVVVDPVRGLRIAAAYLEAPAFDERAVAHYDAFRDETRLQFEYLTSSPLLGGLGIRVDPVPADPYGSASEMADDLRNHRRLRVFASTAADNPHPLLTHDENTMFRAVHDALAHAAIGRGFDRHGEEAAWLKHASMYTPAARRALTTETRGQNSAMIFGYRGDRFPEQKVALLPTRYSDLADVTLLDRTGLGEFQKGSQHN